MVELALVLPVLVMLLVGITQFGLAYSTQVSIQGAAREGARVLALGGPEAIDEAKQAVRDAAPGVGQATITFPNGGVIPCDANGSSGPAEYSTMTVNATYTLSIPFFLGNGTKTMSATARMRCGL